MTDVELKVISKKLNTLVDKKHRLLACLPPNAACSTWQAILLNNSGFGPMDNITMQMLHNTDILKRAGIVRLRALDGETIRSVLKTFYKFMITRHPLERLVSAYIDKLQSGSDTVWQKNLGKIILHETHKELAPETVNLGQGVLFQEFIWYINEIGYHNEEHWAPISELCEPCIIDYDRIVKLETHSHDTTDIIIKKLAPTSYGTGLRKNIVMGGPKTALKSGQVVPMFHNLSSHQIILSRGSKMI